MPTNSKTDAAGQNTRVTKIGCAQPDICACDPVVPKVSGGKLPEWTKGVDYDANIEFVGTSPVLEVMFLSSGLTAKVDGSVVNLSGKPTSAVSLVVKATNECTDCEVYTFKGAEKLACVPLSITMPNLGLSVDGTLSEAVPYVGTTPNVTTIIAPSGVTATADNGFLQITGNTAGKYKILLKNECSEVLLEGEISAVSATPKCRPISVISTIGNPVFIERLENSYTWVLDGTTPIKIEELPDLQNGLSVSLSENVDGTTSLTVSGTALPTPCQEAGSSECAQKCVTLSNPCGKKRVCQTISFKALEAEVPKPPFCAGLIFRVSPNTFTGYYFPPNSKLFVDHVEAGTAGAVIGTQEFDVDGNGIVNVVLVSPIESTCPAQLREYFFRHETCGIILNYASSGYTYKTTENCP